MSIQSIAIVLALSIGVCAGSCASPAHAPPSDVARLRASVKASAADAVKLLEQEAQGRVSLSSDARHRLYQIKQRGE